ncbi:hypothetical protein HOU14_gp09 [Dickeya phage Luksen]|uniref:Uncharacterized protein n=1 Tax=Dickeya phage Luksen TaxID=2320192 RepID=A0A385IGK6_9CAUD|nr:hypothetical protein HOU14_gp09 [Dickeya phage Luksen]AXY81834.1 hypothetical protein [Dickeya phage Luksen]
MKAKTITKTIITSIDRGDIFQVIRDCGCYPKGHLLIVIESGSSTNREFIEFAPPKNSSGAYGDFDFIASAIDASEMRYAGTIDNPDIISL